MTWSKLLKSKFFLFVLFFGLAVFAYFFSRELGRQYSIQGEITTLEQEVDKLESKNQELSDLIAYFKTESFQEREIRSKLNLQRPGEHVVALPSNSNEAVATERRKEDIEEDAKNWRLWWNYFFEEKID